MPARVAGQHQCVEVAEMPDPKDLALDLAEAVAERQVEPVEHDPAEGVGVVARRHQHRGQGRAVGGRIDAEDLQPPGLDRAARRRGEPGVAREHVVEALVASMAVHVARVLSQALAGAP